MSEDRYLVYSKASSDSLPITTTLVTGKPCLNPTQSTSQGNFYPTELDRLPSVCRKVLGQEYDSRYSDAGLSLTQYELQASSRVVNLLQALPLSDKYINIEEKK